MSVLDGFLTTVGNVRATFGEGIPEHFDGEALSRLNTDVAAAAPGPHWSGQAASAYGAVHAEHGQVLSALADLDKRLAVRMDAAARVVAAGRQEIDAQRSSTVQVSPMPS